jgi:hypothetical protein
MIVDRATGLPLAGATVSSEPRTATVTTDNTGHFSITLAPGTYRLEARKDGYQPAVTGGLHPVAGQTLSAILALQRGESDLSIIATATSRASAALRTSTTFYRTLNVERLQRDGTVRAADALRALPGVNNGITGDTGTFADDVNLNIRGLGTLETQATLDGHAIGYGFPGGYNYNLSPVFALRNIEVVYGSGGSTLTGVDAIGGVVDFQTLDPTPRQQLRVMQGIGSFQNAVSTLSASGTSGRFGYAAAYGVSTIDGPVQNAYLYQPGAAYDQSASAPAVRDLGIYKDDSTAVSRSGLAKVSYDAAPRTRVSFTTLASSIWDDKTGNGDGDYLAYPQALAFGKHLLAVKSSNDPCGSGTFTGTNANGVPNGSGPGGMPDGGTRCQTPEQWARFNAGYQGAGPSWQSFNLQDEDLAVATDSDRRSIRADLYVSRFAQTFDRTWQLPFKNAPGDRANWRNRQVVESGASISDDLHLGRNDLGFGFSWMNDAYLFTQKGLPAGAPIVHETAFFLRDAYHPSQKLYAYANAWFKHASETNSSYVDSRLSLAYAAGSNDVARYAVGTTTAQPSADMLGKTFVESPPGNAGGGASITCSGLNSIGTAPSSVLRPERGVDQELAYGHRFSGDSQVQLSLYNVDVFDKLYSTLQPLGAAGGAYINPAYLAQVEAIVGSKCGGANVASLLGISGTFNVGRLRSRGMTLDGRWRFSPRTYVDYDWDLVSTAIVAAPQQLLAANKTLILGAQLPRLPLHTLDLAFDHTIGGGLDFRFTLHTVSANNTKALPPYNYSDLTATYPLRNGVLAFTVNNLFNQFADDRGLRYEGEPLPLNAYATPADYAPVTGAASTERFGLPPRTLFLSYTAMIR